jgi:hypothetical protein
VVILLKRAEEREFCVVKSKRTITYHLKMLEIITLLLLQATTLFGTPATSDSTAAARTETTATESSTPVDPPLQIGDNGWGHD